MSQPTLFNADPTLPEGFRYQSNLLTPDQEQELLRHIQPLPFKDFDFHGFQGKRRIVSFGHRYNFTDRELQDADEMPAFLLPLRDKAAHFANLPSDSLQHVLVTEYSPGAAIGWHRDKAVFEKVIGISLLAPARFRFRRKSGSKWDRADLTLAPRSVYLLDGPARTEWEHSIPPMEQLRYSITFRNLR